MEDFFTKSMFLIAGALMGATITFLMNIRKLIVEQHNEKCKEMIKSVASSTELSFDYWSSDDKDEKYLVKEARLFSSFCLVESYYTNLYKSLRNGIKLQAAFAEYSRELTGGDFRVKSRPADPERMNKIAQLSGVLISTIYDCYKKR